MNESIRPSMESSRNYGIDLLRIVSMIGIVGLHFLNHGGVLNGVNRYQISSNIAWFWEILFYSSTSTFAMITGFLYFDRKSDRFHSSAIINLIITTFFWCVILLLIFLIVSPTSIGGTKSFVYFIFPPAKGGKTGGYWYLTSYVLLFFMIPYINKLVFALNNKKMKMLLILLFFFFSAAPTFGFRDYFVINEGYSPFWLIFCYLIGSYVHTYQDDIRHKWLILVVLLSNVVFLLFSKQIIAIITNLIFGHQFATNILITYVSPFILADSILMLFLFRDIKINNSFSQKIIMLFSSGAFDVYIIHCHPLIFDNFITDRFVFVSEFNCFCLIGSIIAFPIAVYLICWTAGFFRRKIFSFVKIDVAAVKIGEKIDSVFGLKEI